MPAAAMTRGSAALLALAAATLVAGAPGPSYGGPEAGTADGGQAAAPSADAGAVDPDQDIVEHLDEVQNLELLQNLELFDPKLEEK